MWAGIVAPVLFVSIFVIEGRLRARYDSRAMYISALSLRPRGRVQILNLGIPANLNAYSEGNPNGIPG
jgi:hypothetical protein